MYKWTIESHYTCENIALQSPRGTSKSSNHPMLSFLPLAQKIGIFDLTDSDPIDFNGVQVQHLNFFEVFSRTWEKVVGDKLIVSRQDVYRKYCAKMSVLPGERCINRDPECELLLNIEAAVPLQSPPLCWGPSLDCPSSTFLQSHRSLEVLTRRTVGVGGIQTVKV